MSPSDYHTHQLNRQILTQKLAKVDRAWLSGLSDIELAKWQTEHPSDSPQFLLAGYEWNLRLMNRQIQAADAASWRGVIGTLAGAVLGVVATLAAVWLQNTLDQKPQDAHARALQSQAAPPTAPPPNDAPFAKPVEFRLNP